jgi:hypothetical protein
MLRLAEYHRIQQSSGMSPKGVRRWSLPELDTPTGSRWQTSNRSSYCRKRNTRTTSIIQTEPVAPMPPTASRGEMNQIATLLDMALDPKGSTLPPTRKAGHLVRSCRHDPPTRIARMGPLPPPHAMAVAPQITPMRTSLALLWQHRHHAFPSTNLSSHVSAAHESPCFLQKRIHADNSSLPVENYQL